MMIKTQKNNVLLGQYVNVMFYVSMNNFTFKIDGELYYAQSPLTYA